MSRQHVLSKDPEEWEDCQYWCHSCRHKFASSDESDVDEVRCPVCGGEFVEEVEDDSDPSQFHAAGSEELADERRRRDPPPPQPPSGMAMHIFGHGQGSGPQPHAGGMESLMMMLGGGGPGGRGGGGGMTGMVDNLVGGGRGFGNVQFQLHTLPMLFGGGDEGEGDGSGAFFNVGNYAFGDLDALLARLTDLGRIGTPPAAQDAVRGLPSVRVAESDLEHCRECTVCQEEYGVGETVLKLPCGHFFHAACVLPWLKEHCTCPTCRLELPTDDEEWEASKDERNQRIQ